MDTMGAICKRSILPLAVNCPPMSDPPLSERDVCTKLITPAVERAGWDIQSQVREEVSLTAPHRKRLALLTVHHPLVALSFGHAAPSGGI